jgi:tetratricopeptide (TPR) repeat protein
VPPEITFISLPQGLAQFHHLPTHVPIWIHRQAEAEEKGYDFNEGAGAMEELLRKAPGVPGAYLYQLFLKKWPKWREINPYFESNRIAEAIPKLVEILQIDPECPLTCFQLGFCFRATGELEKSESFYRQALRMAPDAGWIYSNLGRTYQALAENRKAAEAYWKALELLPGDHFVLEQLVVLGELFVIPQPVEKAAPGANPTAAFVKRDEYEKKMREWIEKEKDPGHLTQLGWRMVQDRLFDLACQCFEAALQADRRASEALLGLGCAHLEARQFKEAERYLGEYLDEKPESAVGHLNLFKAYLALEEKDMAWDEIQTAVRLDPSRLDALRQLYALLREAGRKEEGLDWMDRLAEEHPGVFTPLLVKAQGLAEDDHWPAAEEAVREGLRRAPHNEELLLFYTSELGKRGKRKELIHLLETETGPLPLSLTINLALALSQNGQLEKGKQLLRDFTQRPGLSPLEKGRAKVILAEFEREK